ncbi:hypothetical protein [Phenylobacterium montanum]|uniref:SnoaL-like domain-containing protein n=1 Tax=Phenylobacterium montanum TaxID=2823693 RepID=A0A975IWG2_9CAUL|nr:hypothetical protein [Caulobacter sp. S6]QUD89838.1 hypothetical protein KCG34_08205 [Caulobacter sp. S6]
MSSQPGPAMMAPIERIARFIAGGEEACLSAFADDGVTIVENFAPYLFTGPAAAQRWAEAMRAHTTRLTNLAHRFEPACDFSITEDRAYFSLPTHWSGTVDGRRFEEDGGWAFVLVNEHGDWRVLSYGWAVTRFAMS